MISEVERRGCEVEREGEREDERSEVQREVREERGEKGRGRQNQH